MEETPLGAAGDGEALRLGGFGCGVDGHHGGSTPSTRGLCVRSRGGENQRAGEAAAKTLAGEMCVSAELDGMREIQFPQQGGLAQWHGVVAEQLGASLPALLAKQHPFPERSHGVRGGACFGRPFA